MMDNMEKLYQAGDTTFLYYNALRNGGLTFEDILYGIAIPQKKGFLCGDNAEAKDDFHYNAELKISFNSCKFINLCDRIPKVRGGQCYFYNSLIDSTQYLKYRDKVKELGKNAVTSVNSTWKCAGVSQGAIVSYGGYLHFENTMIKGVAEVIKNNDTSANTFTQNIGYFNFINCTYQLNEESIYYEGSTTDYEVPKPFYLLGGNVTIAEGVWPRYDGSAPVAVKMVRLNNLIDHLNNSEYGCGTKQNVTSWLVSNLV